MERQKVVAIIFAGGTGTRMGNRGRPKQFLEVYGKPILVHTVEHFQSHEWVDDIYITSNADFVEYTEQLVKKYGLSKVKKVLPGGETSQHSIFIGLNEVALHESDKTIVLIHDGVRPMITSQAISDNIENVRRFGSSITVSKANETVVVSSNGETVDSIPVRDHGYRAQAPQSFFLGEIYEAHKKERISNPTYANAVDACTIMHRQGKPVHLTEGNSGNIKITTPEDYYMFLALLQYNESQDIFGL